MSETTRDPLGRFTSSTSEIAAHARAGKIAKRRERQEKAAQVARDTMTNYVERHGLDRAKSYAIAHGDTYLLAWGEIVKQQLELATSPDQRGSTGAARFVAQAAELVPDGQDKQPQYNAQQQIVINIEPDAAERMLARLLSADPNGIAP